VKAALEIELLHNKIDALREQEILQLLNIIQRLSAHLARACRSYQSRSGTG